MEIILNKIKKGIIVQLQIEIEVHLEIWKKVHENKENWQMADKKTVKK